MNFKPKKVKALPGYKIRVESEVGKGIFKFWNNQDNFKKVFINSETDGIAWNDKIEICPETVYYNIKENQL